ncbi:MAG: isochorismatase family protein [Planctomycetes bacterium]|nr:isochorismatase family protein [Planctomycetota bacterium]MBM4084727.1 isochorismatase family protein [Planctomycetota bacterium]
MEITMPYLEFPVRFTRMQTEGLANDEANFRHAEKVIRLNAAETAFVLIDVWDCATVPPEALPGGKSFCDRAGAITEQKIRPALAAARGAGLTIIHAPTSYVSEKYPQYHELAKRLGTPAPSAAPPGVAWPPREFVAEQQKDAWSRRYERPAADDKAIRKDRTFIPKVVEPRPDEFLIATGAQMNQILAERKILNLIYVGFATNMCLLEKPGAVREMAHQRWYRTIVLRDCTTAVEHAETVADLAMTKTFLLWMEMCALAYTATAQAFIQACRQPKR